MKTNNIIIYHNKDMDGFCSGAIARMAKEKADNDIVMIGWDYDDPIPAFIEEGNFDSVNELIMTDISFPPNIMSMLFDRLGHRLTWIDHHRSAINDSRDRNYSAINGSRYEGDSASLIAWKWFFSKTGKVPTIIYFVDKYDVWKKDKEWDDVMIFQYGMKSLMGDPCNELNYTTWKHAINKDHNIIKAIQSKGGAIKDYIDKQDEITASRGFTIAFEDIIFCVVNSCIGGSQRIDRHAGPVHDGLMVFGYDGPKKLWVVSMYKNEKYEGEHPDLSVIAKKYGGGGHPGACRFTCKELPFNLPK